MNSRNQLGCLAQETSIDLYLNGKQIHTFLCTPENLDHLVLGYLFNTGYIHSMADIRELHVYEDLSVVRVFSDSSEIQRLSGKNVSTHKFNLEEIQSHVEFMFKNAVSYRRTGGMHSAALVLEWGECRVFEDVGRHNAVDKAIGYGVKTSADLSGCCILSSGRIALEIVSKIFQAHIPVLVSRSIPTTAAYSLAEKQGITLIGRITSQEPIIYTGSERIVDFF